MQSKQHEQFDQSKRGRAAVASGNIWDMSICSENEREQYRAINPNLNGKRHSDERIRMPQRRTGAAGHGMLETETETVRDSGGYSSSLLCMKSLTVYHLQDKAEQSRADPKQRLSNTHTLPHTHTDIRMYVCRQAGRQLVALKRKFTLTWKPRRWHLWNATSVASVVVVVANVARKSLSGLLPAACWLSSTSWQAHPGTGSSQVPTSCYSMQQPEPDGIDFCVPPQCRVTALMPCLDAWCRVASCRLLFRRCANALNLSWHH